MRSLIRKCLEYKSPVLCVFSSESLVKTRGNLSFLSGVVCRIWSCRDKHSPLVNLFHVLFKVLVHRDISLTLSRRRPLSYRNQSIDLRSKSMGWFLHDNGLRHERVKWPNAMNKNEDTSFFFWLSSVNWTFDLPFLWEQLPIPQLN